MLSARDPWQQERSYSASAYYEPVSGRRNLHLLTEAIVTEVLLEPADQGGGWVATGARVLHGGEEVNVKALKEVIISAGSVQSPQILELSGIGNRDVLEAAGVPVKIHNPNVGENLQEHISMAISILRSACVLPMLIMTSDHHHLRSPSLPAYAGRTPQ